MFTPVWFLVNIATKTKNSSDSWTSGIPPNAQVESDIPSGWVKGLEFEEGKYLLVDFDEIWCT